MRKLKFSLFGLIFLLFLLCNLLAQPDLDPPYNWWWGNGWQSVYPQNPNYIIEDCSAPEKDVCAAVGERINGSGQPGIFILFTNGGSSYYTRLFSNVRLHGVWFKDSQFGYVVGEYLDHSGLLAWTDDGGVTLHPVSGTTRGQAEN